MMVFPRMLVSAANNVGMKVPPDPNNFIPEEYPHFHVFCILQLNRPIKWGEHWENARIIAEVPDDQIRKLTLSDFIGKGFSWESQI